MKIYAEKQNRDEYFQTQIERSEIKFGYCKVSIRDAIRYIDIIRRYGKLDYPDIFETPMVCLGTRNGREVDLFRIALYHPLLAKINLMTERKSKGFYSPFGKLLFSGRSNCKRIEKKSVVGVEINPHGERKDIWIGSFDEMPRNWKNSFSIIHSNSFDQSQDPYQTAKEWRRIAKKNGFLIFVFPDAASPTPTDPIGNIRLVDVLDLFPGELLWYCRKGSACGYNQAIIRLSGQQLD